MIAIDDPHLPGLSDLTEASLRRITGADTVSLMRFRYRAGKRAVLHLGTAAGGEDRQGAIWFFQGDKARKLAGRSSDASYDKQTAGLYQAFPNDHRMPQIRAFLDSFAEVAPRLLGDRPLGSPELLRYRPGLSCTFRCAVSGGRAVYVKLTADDNTARQAVMNRRIGSLLAGGPLSIAPAVGTDASLSAISYAAARGRPLDTELAATGGTAPVLQAIDALGRFWRLRFTPVRHLSTESLGRRAADSVALVGITLPECRSSVQRILARIEADRPRLGCRPIHADVKLEHLFLDGGRTTLIDTESVSLGPPDYDLAQLCGRLWQAELEGHLPRALVGAAAEEVQRASGDNFRWCLDVVALTLARFYAQRLSPDASARVNAMLERLE